MLDKEARVFVLNEQFENVLYLFLSIDLYGVFEKNVSIFAQGPRQLLFFHNLHDLLL